MNFRVISFSVTAWLLTTLALASSQRVTISSSCLLCICQSLGTCDYSAGCVQGSAGLHCGPFQLTQAYWIDAGRPGHSSGVSFEQCANNRACAEQTVFNYIDRFANDCDHDGQLTCNDFAILHRTGRSSCHLDRIRSTTFWQNFAHSKCFARPNWPDNYNRHSRATRRVPDASSSTSGAVHFPSGPLESFRSFVDSPAGGPFNPFSAASNLNSLPGSVRLIRPASRLPSVPPSSSPSSSSARVNPLLPGSLRVVNHNDRAIGYSRPNSVSSVAHNSAPPPTSPFALTVAQPNSNRRGESARNRNWSNETAAVVSNQCLQCICDASTGCDRSHRCSGQFCGPYLISWPYWHDAGSLGKNFLACATDFNCARDSVRSYMRRNTQDCDRDGRLSCDDYAVIHQLGGGSCSAGYDQVRQSLYWSKFRRCMASNGEPTDANYRYRDLSPRTNPITSPSPRPTSPSPPVSLSSTSVAPSIIARVSPLPSIAFSVEDRPEVDAGNDLNDFRESRRNSDSGDWRPVIVTNNRNNNFNNHEVGPNSITESSIVRSTNGFSSSTEPYITPSTTRRPLNSYTRPPRPGPRAFEIVSISESTSLPPRSQGLPFISSSPSPNNNLGHASFVDPNRNALPSSAPFSNSIESSLSTSPRSPPNSANSYGPGASSTTELPRSSLSNVLPVASSQPSFNVTVEQSCLDCICEATSGCEQRSRCQTNEFGEYVCGPFAMNRFFWTEAGKPGDKRTANSFESCALDRECSQHTIRSYMDRNPIDCNDDGAIDCLDFAALARLGKAACNLHSLLDSNYWTKFQQCYGFGDD